MRMSWRSGRAGVKRGPAQRACMNLELHGAGPNRQRRNVWLASHRTDCGCLVLTLRMEDRVNSAIIPAKSCVEFLAILNERLKEIWEFGMKVSEKSLELNIGAELLARLRGPMNMPKAYLRGLTQREEGKEGVDLFAHLSTTTRLFAFQFKAPRGPSEDLPYIFTLSRKQHSLLHTLAKDHPRAVHYVLPFYVSTRKLVRDVPNLFRDTWLLPAAPLDVHTVFSDQKTKRIRCVPGTAYINPEYEMKNLGKVVLSWEDGIRPGRFAEWYRELCLQAKELYDDSPRRNPQIVRGMRITIVERGLLGSRAKPLET